ncbi:MAG: UrcA family protein [Sphingomonas sp.]
MNKFALAAATIALLGAAGSPATAKDGSWRVGNDEIHVVYSDIDPNTSSGRAVLLARVERAAKKLCDNEIVKVIRRDCIRSVLTTSAALPRNAALQLALAENNGLPLAAR